MSGIQTMIVDMTSADETVRTIIYAYDAGRSIARYKYKN